jgi:hypothetical protein
MTTHFKSIFATAIILLVGNLDAPKAFSQNSNPNQDPSGSGRGIQREDGSERGNCPIVGAENKKLTALIHEKNTALTVDETPTILVYNPYASSTSLYGMLRLQEKSPPNKYTNVVEPLKVKLPNLAGIVILKIPKIPKKNSLYYWSFTIECKQDNPSVSSGDSSDNFGVRGKIEWRDPSPKLLNLSSKRISIEEQSALYSKEGFWLSKIVIQVMIKNGTDYFQCLIYNHF